MILKESYREDIVSYVKELPEAAFVGITKDEVLKNEDMVECMWTLYQKYVEDYDCDEEWSQQETVKEVLGRNIRIDIAMEEKAGVKIEISRTLEISTAHISQEDDEWLRTNPDEIVSYEKKLGEDLCGWFILADSEKLTDDAVPESVRAVIRFACANGCQWISLDGAGPVYADELTIYEW